MSTSNAAVDLSVVIPTFNRASQLRQVLDSLANQDAGDVRYEVVVVDNNSTDDTRSVANEMMSAARPGLIRYVFEPRPGVRTPATPVSSMRIPLRPSLRFSTTTACRLRPGRAK